MRLIWCVVFIHTLFVYKPVGSRRYADLDYDSAANEDVDYDWTRWLRGIDASSLPSNERHSPPLVQQTDSELRKRTIGDNHICRIVCSYCRQVAAVRIAALCRSHCVAGDRAFMACLTLWSIRVDMDRYSVQ